MSELREQTAWMDRAACKGVPLEVFFPAKEGHFNQARAICAGCPVLAECRKANFGERYGFFAGMTATERKEAGGANNPLPDDFEWDSRGCVVDEGRPEPETRFEVRFDPKTPHGKQLIRRMVSMYTDEKLATTMIAKILTEDGIPVSDGTVNRYVSEYGEKRSRTESRAIIAERIRKQAEEAVRLSQEEGLGLRAIGRRLGITKSTARNRLVLILGEEAVAKIGRERVATPAFTRGAAKPRTDETTQMLVKAIKNADLSERGSVGRLADEYHVTYSRIYNLRKSIAKGIY